MNIISNLIFPVGSSSFFKGTCKCHNLMALNNDNFKRFEPIWQFLQNIAINKLLFTDSPAFLKAEAAFSALMMYSVTESKPFKRRLNSVHKVNSASTFPNTVFPEHFQCLLTIVRESGGILKYQRKATFIQ